MSGGPVVHARVTEQLMRLRLGFSRSASDAILPDAARQAPTYLDFLAQVLGQEIDAKQRKRIAMGVQIAHFPTLKTLEDFDFKFQPSLDQRLVRELATGRYITQAENVLIFGPPGVGKTHLAIALGRAAVETGHSVLFTSATALLAALFVRGEFELSNLGLIIGLPGLWSLAPLAIGAGFVALVARRGRALMVL